MWNTSRYLSKKIKTSSRLYLKTKDSQSLYKLKQHIYTLEIITCGFAFPVCVQNKHCLTQPVFCLYPFHDKRIISNLFFCSLFMYSYCSTHHFHIMLERYDATYCYAMDIPHPSIVRFVYSSNKRKLRQKTFFDSPFSLIKSGNRWGNGGWAFAKVSFSLDPIAI